MVSVDLLPSFLFFYMAANVWWSIATKKERFHKIERKFLLVSTMFFGMTSLTTFTQATKTYGSRSDHLFNLSVPLFIQMCLHFADLRYLVKQQAFADNKSDGSQSNDEKDAADYLVPLIEQLFTLIWSFVKVIFRGIRGILMALNRKRRIIKFLQILCGLVTIGLLVGFYIDSKKLQPSQVFSFCIEVLLKEFYISLFVGSIIALMVAVSVTAILKNKCPKIEKVLLPLTTLAFLILYLGYDDRWQDRYYRDFPDGLLRNFASVEVSLVYLQLILSCGDLILLLLFGFGKKNGDDHEPLINSSSATSSGESTDDKTTPEVV